MQTEAEKYLIEVIKKYLKGKTKVSMINLGAAKSTVIEESLGFNNFICDRIDIQNCTVKKPFVGKSVIGSMEDMSALDSSVYDLAFANFVMEHVPNVEKAVQEMRRIIKREGLIILSLSNPEAPEFILAKLIPTWFHQLFRKEDQDEAYPVKYSYKTIRKIIGIFQSNGFSLLEDKRFGAVYSYLYNWPLISSLAKFYDKIGIKGHIVLVLQRN